MSGTPPTEDTKPLTVNEIINENITKTTDDNGKWTGAFEGLDELQINDDKKEAVRAEMRRRHTDQTYTRTNQELIEARAEVNALKALLPETPNLSREEQEELDELKYSDPDAWFEKVGQIKSEAKSHKSRITDEALAEARNAASLEFEINRRAQALEEFNKRNPDSPLTDDQIRSDIPPRLLTQVKDGKMSFDEMLVKAHAFINTTKVIDNPGYDSEPSFDGTPGYGELDSGTAEAGYENMKF